MKEHFVEESVQFVGLVGEIRGRDDGGSRESARQEIAFEFFFHRAHQRELMQRLLLVLATELSIEIIHVQCPDHRPTETLTLDVSTLGEFPRREVFLRRSLLCFSRCPGRRSRSRCRL